MKRLDTKGSSCKTYIFKRYINNIFAMFESELDAEAFHTYLNTKRKIIKFTYKKQIKNKLLILDILRIMEL